MDVGIFEMWRLIYTRLLAGLNLQVFFANSGLSAREFQLGYMTLFFLFSVIYGLKTDIILPFSIVIHGNSLP